MSGPGWLGAAVGLSAAAGGIALGRLAAWESALLASALLGAALVVPELVPVLLVAVALGSPLALPTGTDTEVNAALLAVPALVAVWALQAWRRGDWAVLRLPSVRVIAALAGVAAVSMAVGNLPMIGFGRTASLAAQLGGVTVFAASAAAFLLGADLLRDPRALRITVWVYVGIGLVLIGGRLVPELDQLAWWLIPAGGEGSLTWTWFAALAAGQVVANRSLHWRLRLILAVGLVALAAHGLDEGRGWVSGWLPPLVALATVVVCARPRLGIALIVAAGVAAALNAPRVIRHVLWGDNRYSLDTRLDAWRIVSEIAAANPLLGIGPSNYYHVTPLFEIRGYHVHFSSHSTFVDLAAQTGLIGLACFGCFCWLLAREGWRLLQRVPAGFARGYACGALGGLAGTLTAGALGDWVLPFVYNVTLKGLRSSLPAFLFLGGLVALGRGIPGALSPPAWLRRWRVLAQPRVALPIVIALFVGLRVGAALLLGDRAVPVSGAHDQVSYDALAQRLLGGHGFSFGTSWYPFTQADAPTSHWSFLYTLYLAGVYAVAGHHPLVARLLQALASGVICWLTFRIGRRLFDARVGLAAALLSAGYAYGIFFGAALMTQTFYVAALLGALDRALAVVQRPRLATWLGLGFCLGAGALLRQTLLLFAPLLLAWSSAAARARPRWSGAVAAAAVVALCVLPWTARNYLAFGDFLLLNSNGGYFLYAANHPEQGVDFDPTRAPSLPDHLRGQGEPAIDRSLFRTALAHIAADPVRYAHLSWSRVRDYYWVQPSPDSTSVANLARGLSFALYAPFMLYGLWCSRGQWRACLPLYLYVAFDAALHLGSWAAPRYRLPSDAVLMVFAGLAVIDLAPRLRRSIDPDSPARAAAAAAAGGDHG